MRLTFLLPLLLLAACGRSNTPGSDLLRLDLERRDPEPLLRFYVGSYLGPDGGDPFAAGLVTQQEGTYFLDAAALRQRLPEGAPSPDADGDGRVVWDEFAGFIDATYARARNLPPTLADFRAAVPYGGEGWFTVELNGVMTSARRKLFVSESALRGTLAGYHSSGETLIYPVGTVIVGEHHLDGAHAETTIMQKRGDGFWDFFVYDGDGALASSTTTPPRPLRSPTQCVGCHFGNREFEPEASFPGPAAPGPEGPRAIYTDLRDAEIVRFFDEHRKRSDRVLGLYNTLFVSKLRAERAAGRLSAEDAQLIDGLAISN